jgi:phage gp29-like protein
MLFQKGMLERIYAPKWKEITGWRKNYNDFHEVHFSQNNTEGTKLMTIGWVEHVSRIEETRKFQVILLEKLKSRTHSKDKGTDGRITSNYI